MGSLLACGMFSVGQRSECADLLNSYELMIIKRKEYQTMKTLQDYIDKLNKLNFKEMYENDFFLTWEKTEDELEAV